jgi:hypothetical protein|tara:strand:+ start:2681 stop:2971 length:291 start_codon:yes stop_codon:yes gene_type:complete
MYFLRIFINYLNIEMTEKKSISTIFINKIIEEFNKNEANINNKLIKPLLNKIYQNIYHYMYFIFIILLLLLILLIINYITLLYYIKMINKKLVNLL